MGAPCLGPPLRAVLLRSWHVALAAFQGVTRPECGGPGLHYSCVQSLHLGTMSSRVLWPHLCPPGPCSPRCGAQAFMACLGTSLNPKLLSILESGIGQGPRAHMVFIATTVRDLPEPLVRTQTLRPGVRALWPPKVTACERVLTEAVELEQGHSGGSSPGGPALKHFAGNASPRKLPSTLRTAALAGLPDLEANPLPRAWHSAAWV